MMGGQGAMGPMMGHGAMGPMMGHGAMGPMMGNGAMGSMMGSIAEGQIAFLKAELGITKDQESAFEPIAAAIRSNGARMQEMHNAMSMRGQGTAEQRIDASLRMMEGRAEALKALKAALPPLYAVLTEQQKRKADQALAMGMMGM
jgi:hypothetical protein